MRNHARRGLVTGAVALLLGLPAVLPARAVPGPRRSFYFAEGTTRPGFAEELDLANPTPVDGVARVTYVFADGGGPLERFYSVAAEHTLAVSVNDAVGPGRDVSMHVDTPLGWITERPLYFKANGWTGGHDQVGTEAPAPVWNFAEGTTLPGFDEFLTLQNPNPDQDALVTIDYLTEACQGPGNATRRAFLPRSSRLTVHVNDGPRTGDANGLGVMCTGVSAVVSSTNGVPIVAERPLYFVRDFGAGRADDGHDVFGVPAASREWFLAEGTTLPGFHEFLALANPGDAPANVTLSYQTERDGSPVRGVVVPARGRTTVQVYTPDGPGHPGGIGPGISGASVHITADQPVLVERPLYVVRDFGGGVRATGGHNAQGARAPSMAFGFASGSTGRWMVEFVTVQNTSAADAHLLLFYFGPRGSLGVRAITVAGTTRATIRVDDASQPGALGPGEEGPVGLTVSSDRPVLVERPAYFDRDGADGASDSVGAVVDARATVRFPIRALYGTDEVSPTQHGVAASLGFTAVISGTDRGALDAIAALGLKAFVWLEDYDNSTCRFEQNDDWVRAELAGIADHPAILAYYLADEPYANLCPTAPADIAARTDLVHRLDPGSRTFIVIDDFNGRDWYPYDQWVSSADVMGVDIYPCRRDRPTCHFDEITAARQRLDAAGVSHYWAVVQAFEDDTWRYPTADELRQQLAMWHDSRAEGYLVFSWWWHRNVLSTRPDLLAVLAGENGR